MIRRLLPACAFLVGLLLPGPRSTVRADETRDALRNLERALKRGESAERLQALRAVEGLARTLTKTQSRGAAVTIRKALDGERDPHVRGAQLRTLSRLGGTTGWVPVIVAWLGAGDEATKAAARKALLWGGGDYLTVVERLLKEDADPTFRANLALLLGDRRRPDAVPLLLTVLEDRHGRVTSAGAEALEAITGQAFGYDAVTWRAWWDEEGKHELAAESSVSNGETVTTAEPREFPEPAPHVTRSLLPDFYGLKLAAKDIVFVLDISGSVGAGGVSRAKKALIRTVDALGSDVWIAALFFDEEVRMWKPEMVRCTPAHKAELTHFLRGIRPGKRTDVFTPLNAGLQIVRRRLAAREASGEPIREAITMIVVSDGVETQSHTPPEVVADKLDRLDPVHTVVHAVALGAKGSRLMRELARRGGGHYVQAR